MLRAVLVALLLVLPAHAADDVPHSTMLPDGSVLLNPAAFASMDAEVQRLQKAEIDGKERERIMVQSTLKFTLVGVSIGFTAGVVVGAIVVWNLKK